MGKQFQQLMEKQIHSKEDAKEQEPISMDLSTIKEQNEAPKELSFATPSITPITPKFCTTHPYSWFPSILDAEVSSMKDFVTSGLSRTMEEQLLA